MTVPVPTEPPEIPGAEAENDAAGLAAVPEGAGTRESWSASERHALARLMAPRPFEVLGTPSDTRWDRLDRTIAERHADAVLAAGYVRFHDDNETVERLAKAIADAKYPELRPRPQRRGPTEPDRRYARAVLTALRGGA